MGNKLLLCVALVTGITFSLPVAAKLYKWVDEKGTTHYGETIPPEYANKDRVELNQAGRVIKNEEVVTPERRHAKELEEAKKRDEENVVVEQRRHDRTLLNTYSNVKEIDQARIRSVQQIDASINVLNAYIKTASDNLLGLQKEAEGYTNRNRKIPVSLEEDLQESQGRLAKLQHDAEKPNAEKAALEARFATDKARYMVLTGKK